ncbi:MAG: hypothetical protein HKO96_04610, partial [Flavobacteriaceae bacterium]|nr:hypothetical protein [Flavobacteriaceae bacterium]
GMLGLGGAETAEAAGSMDLGSIVGSVAGGGVGGGIILAIVGAIKHALNK